MKRLADPVGDLAVRFAKCYTQLTEALMMQGVPEDRAREEARLTAITWLGAEYMYDEEEQCCPNCGWRPGV